MKNKSPRFNVGQQLSRYKTMIFSLLAFGTISMLSSPILPLYDGVGFPDEAYRYLSPPAGSKPTAPAAGGGGTSGVKDGTNADVLQLTTPENGPQVQVVIVQGQLSFTSPNAKIVHAAIEPVTPTVLPSDGTIVGNVYAVSARALDGQVSLSKADPTDRYTHLINMRQPQGAIANPTIEYRAPDSKDWIKADTVKTGSDIYQTTLHDFGEYAVVSMRQQASGAQQGAPTAKHHLSIAILIVSGIATLMAIIIATVRYSRSRA